MLVKREDISLYWQTILDTIQEGLMVVSPAGRVLSMNQAAERITGYSSGELVGQSCTMLECTGCHIYGKGVGPEWCELFVSGAVADKRCMVTGKDRGRIFVSKRATVIKDDAGQVIGAVETLTDISTEVEKEQEIKRLRRSLSREDGFHGIVGASGPMRRIFSLIEDAARSDAAVMITGESGTGKELVAQAIHRLGPRSKNPFVKVDCVTLSESVLESELFGHVKGAFTGAGKSRTGRFEAAEGGHVFLDEIGDVPHAIQVKLLRVLEEKVIERVGDNKPVKVDVRVITATNRNLPQMLEDGLFREDLYYRINVVPIRLPALRERIEDLPLLARTFVERLAAKTGNPIHGFSSEAMAMLHRYHWPGNIRELKNAIEYAFVVCRQDLIGTGDLPEPIREAVSGSICLPSPTPAPDRSSTEKDELLAALKQAGGNQSQAARILNVSRMTVWKRMKKHHISVNRDVG